MNVPVQSRAGVAGLSLVVAFMAIGAAGAAPRRPPAVYVQRAYPAQRQFQLGFGRVRAIAPICTSTSATNAYVALPGLGDYAGADVTSVLGGEGDEACDMYSSVVAGSTNYIGNKGNAVSSFIGAGDLNLITSEGSAVVAGYSNSVGSEESIIGAGSNNVVNGNSSFVGAGDMNSVGAAANYSAVVGGYANTMNGQKAALGGGEQNTVAGSFATIPGGYRNEALGNESFAAGSQAEARYTGSFVWSDYVPGENAQTDSHAGEFVARASGGVYFFSNATSSTGVHLAAGSGTWSSLSDRNEKTDVVPLDDASILAKVASLPISAWQYKTERGVRHVGPMAQDFYAAFGVGEDDRHITSIDEDGVALAAIKALQRENAKLRRENRDLQAGFANLRDRITRLESARTATAAHPQK